MKNVTVKMSVVVHDQDAQSAEERHDFRTFKSIDEARVAAQSMVDVILPPTVNIVVQEDAEGDEAKDGD